MQITPSKETQYLFTLYEMCKSNIINQAQKGELKDLLIMGDRRTQKILKVFQENHNKQELEKGILEILDQSDGSQSIYSVPSQYKTKRPKPVQVRSQEKKNWACKSQDSLHRKMTNPEDLLQTKKVGERHSFNHLEIQCQFKNSIKRQSGNFYIESFQQGFRMAN